MITWTIHARRIAERPDALGRRFGGCDLPILVTTAYTADQAADWGHRVAGDGIPGLTRTIVKVVAVDAGPTEPVTTIRWWLNGSEPEATQPVTRLRDDRAVWWAAPDGAVWLRVVKYPPGRWGVDRSDKWDLFPRDRQRRYDTPDAVRAVYEDRHGTVLVESLGSAASKSAG